MDQGIDQRDGQETASVIVGRRNHGAENTVYEHGAFDAHAMDRGNSHNFILFLLHPDNPIIHKSISGHAMYM